jgi:replicative superfamily II helicase
MCNNENCKCEELKKIISEKEVEIIGLNATITKLKETCEWLKSELAIAQKLYVHTRDGKK